MLAQPNDVIKDSLHLLQVFPSYSQGKVRDGLIVVQNVEGKQINMNFDIIQVASFSRSCG